MSIDIYDNSGLIKKLTINAALSSNLHQSLNGECTFDLTMPGNRLPSIVLGDEVRVDDLYFHVTRISRNTQTVGALFSLSCEHISYELADITMPEGSYSGTPASVLTTILSGTPLAVGTAPTSGSFTLAVPANMNRRDALQKWAGVTGTEISYYKRTINLSAHVGNTTVTSLRFNENVKSIGLTMDSNSRTKSYTVELSRLQTLSLGDEVSIAYTTLEINDATRVLSLDYDIFHPWTISMQCGDYVPTFYDTVKSDFEEFEAMLEETIPEEIEQKVEAVFEKVKELDFSGWAEGFFSETLDSEQVNGFLVDFDGNGMPVLITDGEGHETEVIW